MLETSHFTKKNRIGTLVSLISIFIEDMYIEKFSFYIKQSEGITKAKSQPADLQNSSSVSLCAEVHVLRTETIVSLMFNPDSGSTKLSAKSLGGGGE